MFLPALGQKRSKRVEGRARSLIPDKNPALVVLGLMFAASALAFVCLWAAQLLRAPKD